MYSISFYTDILNELLLKIVENIDVLNKNR